MFLDNNSRYIAHNRNRRELFFGSQENPEEKSDILKTIEDLGLGDSLVMDYSTFYQELASWTLVSKIASDEDSPSTRRNLPTKLLVFAAVLGIAKNVEAGKVLRLTTSVGKSAEFEFLGFRSEYKGKTDVFALKFNNKTIFCTLDQFDIQSQNQLKSLVPELAKQNTNNEANNEKPENLGKIGLIPEMITGKGVENPDPIIINKVKKLFAFGFEGQFANAKVDDLLSTEPNKAFLFGQDPEELKKSFPIDNTIGDDEISVSSYRDRPGPGRVRMFGTTAQAPTLRGLNLYSEKGKTKRITYIFENDLDIQSISPDMAERQRGEEVKRDYEIIKAQLDAAFGAGINHRYGRGEMFEKVKGAEEERTLLYLDGLGHAYILNNTLSKIKLQVVSEAEAQSGGNFTPPDRKELEECYKKTEEDGTLSNIFTHKLDKDGKSVDTVLLGLGLGDQGITNGCAPASMARLVAHLQAIRPDEVPDFINSFAKIAGTTQKGGTDGAGFNTMIAAAEKMTNTKKKKISFSMSNIDSALSEGNPILWATFNDSYIQKYAYNYTMARFGHIPTDLKPSSHIPKQDWNPKSKWWEGIQEYDKDPYKSMPKSFSEPHVTTIAGANSEDGVAFTDGGGTYLWLPTKFANKITNEMVILEPR